MAHLAVRLLHLRDHGLGHDLHGESPRTAGAGEAQEAGQHEQGASEGDETGVAPHGLRKSYRDQFPQGSQPVGRRTVQGRAGPRRQRVEHVDHVGRIARSPRPHQIRADLAIQARGARDRGGGQLVEHPLLREQGIELVPRRLARGHEFVLRELHRRTPGLRWASFAAAPPTAT